MICLEFPMAKIKLYSPPIITAKRKLKLGHGANLVWCDILSRTFSRQGFSIDYHFPAWNHQGRMFDDLSKTNSLEKILDEIETTLEHKASLFKLEEHAPYTDTSEESRENAQDKFNKLKEKGFIKLEQNSYFLRIDKIREETGLIEHINGTKFFPEGAKERLLDLIKTLNGAYPITKTRKFATPVPDDESAQKINPIFDLAVSPLLFSREPVDYSVDSLKTMLHGTFIPFVIWSGLYDIPFSKNVAVHGYLSADFESNGMTLDDFYKITNHDVLRGSALLCTSTMEDTKLNQSRIKKILKCTSKLVKIAWFFKNFGFHADLLNLQPSQLFNEGIQNLRHSLVMDKIIEKTFFFSKQLELGNLTEENYPEYVLLLNDSQAFFPSTYERAVEVLKKKNLVI